MTKELQKFLQNNIDLLDVEDWETFFNKLLIAVQNTEITGCLDALNEAGINISELSEIRNKSFIDLIIATFNSLAPGKYEMSEIIYKVRPWHGYILPEVNDFIHFNSSLWPDNIEIIDYGYGNSRIVVK